MLKNYLGQTPEVHPEAFVADDAMLIGNVHLAKDSSVWFKTVLRADDNAIVIGEGSNIQDMTVVHITKEQPTLIGNYVTIGHNAIIHACEIGDYSLIGMGAIVLDGAKIGHHVIIGAGTLITQNKVIPDHSMVYGNPARVVRNLTEEEMRFLETHALEYIELSKNYKLEEQHERQE